MKILLLNPLVDAEQQMLRLLREKGIGVLVSSDAAEAYEILKLHHRTIELAIIHREDVQGNGEPGFHFIDLIKKDPAQSDLPYVITSSKWGPADCAKHQGTSQGANAYLPLPGGESHVLGILEKIFGESLSALPQVSQSPPLRAPTMAASLPAAGPPAQRSSDVPELILEDVATLFETAGEASTSGSIRLEMPDFVEEPKKSRPAQTQAPAPKEPALEEPVLDLMATQVLPSPFSEPGSADAESPDGPELISIDSFEDLPESGIGLSQDPEQHSIELPEELPGSSPANEGGSLLESLLATAPQFEEPSALLEVPADPDASFEAAPEDEDEEPSPAVRRKRKRARPEPEEEYDDADDESMIAREMPYLFGAGSQGVPKTAVSGYDFIQPLGDAVVPGGAAHSPDVETLKKYLLLREGDVAALSTQLKLAREQVGAVEGALQLERSRSAEFQRVIDDQGRRIEEFEKEKKLALEGLQVEIDELKFQTKAKSDRARVLESHVIEATDEMDRLKERVRADIRKIRVREKELENRLEIMKKDSEALIGARENKIIELKRKVDLLEFNMDLLQDQHAREKENSSKVKERLARALQAVRVAGGLLDNERPAVSRRKSDEDPGSEAESA